MDVERAVTRGTDVRQWGILTPLVARVQRRPLPRGDQLRRGNAGKLGELRVHLAAQIVNKVALSFEFYLSRPSKGLDIRHQLHPYCHYRRRLVWLLWCRRLIARALEPLR